MSPLLYRTPILVSRKQAFIDWANGVDHGAPAPTLGSGEDPHGLSRDRF